jgi:hypothetical protein
VQRDDSLLRRYMENSLMVRKIFFVPRPTGRSQWHEEFDLISYLRSVPTGDSEDAELLLPSTRLDSPTRRALSYRGPPRSCVVNTAAVTTPWIPVCCRPTSDEQLDKINLQGAM